MKKRYNILYGYNRDEFVKLHINQKEDDIIMVIEPRGLYIEKFKKEFKTSDNIILLSKMIINNSQIFRSVLYKENDFFSIEKNEKYERREEVFCVTLTYIINHYEIQNIENFIIDIPIIEINEMLLSDFFLYSHLISNVKIRKNIQFDISDNFLPIAKEAIDNEYDYYENRNLDIDLPNICVYITDYPSTNINKPKLLQMIKQYEIETLLDDELVSFENIDEKMVDFQNTSKFTIQQVPDQLEKIFKKKYYDIIIQFNTKYFQSKPFFQLMYPVSQNVLYIDRNIDIIYGNGKTMYKLYEMMYSNEFKEYMKMKKLSKPKLYNLFERRYFYDYLITQFKTLPVIKEEIK